MSLPELDNLVRIGQLKAEPRNAQEVTRMLAMAQTRLSDAKLNKLSLEGRFISAYNAAHALVQVEQGMRRNLLRSLSLDAMAVSLESN